MYSVDGIVYTLRTGGVDAGEGFTIAADVGAHEDCPVKRLLSVVCGTSLR